MMDTDGNGKISFEEFISVMAQARAPPSTTYTQKKTFKMQRTLILQKNPNVTAVL